MPGQIGLGQDACRVNPASKKRIFCNQCIAKYFAVSSHQEYRIASLVSQDRGDQLPQHYCDSFRVCSKMAQQVTRSRAEAQPDALNSGWVLLYRNIARDGKPGET